MKRRRALSHQFDGALRLAVHALSDGGGPAELVGLERHSGDLVQGKNSHPPDEMNVYRSTVLNNA